MWEKGSAAVAGFEDGGRGHQPRQVATLDAGKGKEADSSPEPPEGTQPCQHPDRPVKPMSDFFPTDV